MRVLWAVFVQFILVRPATLRLPSTTPAIPSQPTNTGRESEDQWSRVPTGTVDEQIASIAAVMNSTSVHSLPMTTRTLLSGINFLCQFTFLPEPSSDRLDYQPPVQARLTPVATQLALRYLAGPWMTALHILHYDVGNKLAGLRVSYAR